MKLAVVVDSKTGNTRQAADWIVRGMNLSDVEKVCQAAPGAIVVASHLDSVNHALLTRKGIMEFASEKGLSAIRVPEDGECVIV